MATETSRKQVPETRGEARRRAAILRRYVAIEAPTLDDDDCFAAELGLSRDGLRQLARAWRRHADPALLPGAYTRATSEDRQLAREAAAAPDLSAVDPARRVAIRRRIAELGVFLAVENPTADDEERSAGRLGMSTAAFRRLLRSWILARNPAALAGGSTPPRLPHRHKQTIPAAVEALIADAIEGLGPQANALAVHRVVARRCTEEALKVPSKVTVHQRFVEARARSGGGQGEAMLATDHVALQLQTVGARGTQYPVLSVLLETASGHILAHTLSTDPPTAASTAGLLAKFLDGAGGKGAEAVPLDIATPKARDWDAMLRTLKRGGVVVQKTRTRALRPGRHLTRILGDRLGRLFLRPGLTTRPADGHMRKLGGDSSALTIEEARAVVADIVARHNRGHPLGGAPSFAEDASRRALADALRSARG